MEYENFRLLAYLVVVDGYLLDATHPNQHEKQNMT